MKMKRNLNRGILAMLGVVCLGACAADGTWMATGTGLDWTDPAHWQGGTVGNGAGATVNIAPNVSATVDLNGVATWLNFGSEADDFVLRGGSVELAGAAPGADASLNVGNTVTFLASVGGDVRLLKRGSGTVNFTGATPFWSGIDLQSGTLAWDLTRGTVAAATPNAPVETYLTGGALSVPADHEATVCLTPRMSRTADSSFPNAQLVAGSPRVTVTSTAALSAGQTVSDAAGLLPQGTFIRTILDDMTLELSAAPSSSAATTLSVAAAGVTYTQMMLSELSLGGRLALVVNAGGIFFPVALKGAGEVEMCDQTGSSYGTLKLSNTSSFSGRVILDGTSKLAVQHESVELSPVDVVGLVFHMDASDLSTLTLEGDNVLAWRETAWRGAGDASTPVTATPAGTTRPVLLRNELNGLPVVDLGEPVDDGGMAWSAPVTGIRTFFVVVGSQRGGGTLLGSNGTEPEGTWRFARNVDVMACGGEVRNGNARAQMTYPITCTHALFKDYSLFQSAPNAFSLFLNGDRAGLESTLSGGYDVVSGYFKSDVVDSSASAFARAVAGVRTGSEGGQRLAEVVLYNRVLTDSERLRVQAHLMRKWLGRSPRGFGGPYVAGVHDRTTHNTSNEQLPLAPTAAALTRRLRVETFTQENTCEYLTLAKETLDLTRAKLAKKVRMMEESGIALTARQTATTLPVPGAALHVDAAAGVKVDNAGSVVSWTDVDGGPNFARANPRGSGAPPRLVADGLNGLPVVDFGASSSGQHLTWNTNIFVRACFFVMSVANKSCSFLGSVCPEMSVLDNFTRYNGAGTIWDSGVQAGAYSGICRLDGRLVSAPQQTALPQDRFVLLGQTFTCGAVANAFGCGALEANNLRAVRTGGWKLAEAVIYDRELTDDESLAVQAYLSYKWFGTVLDGFAAPGESYYIPALGAGRASSVLVRGTAPVQVGALFGGERLTLTAPDAVVTIPNVQGSLVLSNACLAASGTIAAGKVTTFAGTTNTLAAGSGTFEGLTVTGALRVKGTDSPTVTALAFNPGARLLLGTGALDVHALSLADGVEIESTVGPDGEIGVVTTCGLSVAGGGAVRLTLDPARVEDPCGQHVVATFGSLAAADVARLRAWDVSVTPALSEKYHVSLAVMNNAVYVSIAPSGMFITVR